MEYATPPGYFQDIRIHEDHAPRSVLYLQCSSETCKEDGVEQTREFQISSFYSRNRISVFRCTKCNNRVEMARIN